MECRCETLAGPGMDLAAACIGHLWMFQDLAPEDLAALSASARRARHERGTALFRQGDPAESLFLIKGGRVKLTKVTADGAEMILDLRQAGDVLGENLMAEESAYPVSAACLEDTLTCGFTRATLQDLVLRHPRIGLQLIRNMSARIVWLTDQVGSLGLTSVEERLYRVLQNVARQHGRPDPAGLALAFPLTHEELGFLVGAHRVTVTRALAALKESGRLLQQGRTLVVPPEAA